MSATEIIHALLPLYLVVVLASVATIGFIEERCGGSNDASTRRSLRSVYIPRISEVAAPRAFSEWHAVMHEFSSTGFS